MAIIMRRLICRTVPPGQSKKLEPQMHTDARRWTVSHFQTPSATRWTSTRGLPILNAIRPNSVVLYVCPVGQGLPRCGVEYDCKAGFKPTPAVQITIGNPSVIPSRVDDDSLVSWPALGSSAQGQAPAGRPRLCWWQLQKSWVAGPSPAMTHGSLFPRVGIRE